MTLIDKFKSIKKAQTPAFISQPDVVILSEPDKTDPNRDALVSSQQLSSEILPQSALLPIAPIQKDIYNLQATADSIITSPVLSKSPIQDGDVLPIKVEEILRNYSSTQISEFIDASRIVVEEKKISRYPRMTLTGPLPEFIVSTVSGQNSNIPSSGDTSLVSNVTSRVRFPTVVITDAYLNDPIKFETDRRLYRDTVTVEIPSGSMTPYKRDIAQYVTVPLGTIPAAYSIATTSGISNRIATERYIKSSFEEF